MSKKKKPQNKKKNQSAKPAQNDAVLSANVNETMASETGETSVAVEAEKTIQETKPTENVQNTKKEDKKADKNQKNNKNAKGKNAKKKEKGKVKRKVKETFAELKKSYLAIFWGCLQENRYSTCSSTYFCGYNLWH